MMLKNGLRSVISKVISLFKDELGGRIMTELLRIMTKGTKKCIIKFELMFKDYKDSLFNDKIILKLQQRFKSDHHKVYTEEVNKIALRSNDDKRLQTFDEITTYPYGINAFKVCESEFQRNSLKKT